MTIDQGSSSAEARELEESGALLTRSILENYERSTQVACRGMVRALEHSGVLDARRAVQEGVQSSVRQFATAALLCLEADPEYPMLVKLISTGREAGGPNPDCNYQWASLHGDHTYRIFGNRGSARLFDIQVHSASPADMKNFKTITSLDGMGYDIPADEEVEIVLSREKQDGYWLELPEGPATILSRQVYSDWDRENPARLMIERVGASYSPPPVSPEIFAERVQMMNDFMRSQVEIVQHVSANYFKGGVNSLEHVPVPSEAGFSAYEYLWGNYVCRPDEAIIVEYEMPRSRYGAINLHNLAGDGAQSHLRHVSINGDQGSANGDGVFRVVISHEDPGVKNWLDTRGRDFGLLMAKFYKPDTVPVARMQVVPGDRLRDFLPDDTDFVTQEERREIMRQRLISVHRRLMTDY